MSAPEIQKTIEELFGPPEPFRPTVIETENGIEILLMDCSYTVHRLSDDVALYRKNHSERHEIVGVLIKKP